jgi:hypothetical protein
VNDDSSLGCRNHPTHLDGLHGLWDLSGHGSGSDESEAEGVVRSEAVCMQRRSESC